MPHKSGQRNRLSPLAHSDEHFPPANRQANVSTRPTFRCTATLATVSIELDAPPPANEPPLRPELPPERPESAFFWPLFCRAKPSLTLALPRPIPFDSIASRNFGSAASTASRTD